MSEIAREITGSKARLVRVVDGHETELGYSIASPTLVIADHTSVPDALRGTGAGLVLAEELVRLARTEGFKIVPLCPFVNAQRRKHPDWADVFAA
ncbi:GNAT family N-acetyltransferase [Pseudaestuariivita sp.]|uniref:GNAT family N-acetyltransferase n=1 Tax=Pseudaestuariivita sp. TaxID=2211669 RepID=UPI0040586A89